MIGKSSLFFLLVVATSSTWGKELRVEAIFEPATITLSSQTTYKITIHGSQDSPMGSLPSVNGLNFSETPRTFRSASFINGVPSVRFELSFTVQAQREGTFTMPSWNLKVGNQTCVAPSANLRVLPPSQKDKIRLAEQRKREQDLSEAAFLDFSIPRPYMFEGETLEGSITLYIWNRLPVTRIEKIPSKSGEGFSLTELGQPVESRNIPRNGKTYNSYSWNFGMTAALPGVQSVSFSSVLRVRVKQNRNSPFGNPFFNDPFFGFGSEEGLEVKSDPFTIDVRAIPTASRPLDFSGAIGSFSLSSSIDQDRVSLGDPVRLTCRISGRGNFSAMPAPTLTLDSKFKSGPPAFNFVGDSLSKYRGEQSFEFIVTPLQPGLLEIPPVQFSFFDPENELYTTIQTSPHKLRVDPGEKWIEPTSSSIVLSNETVNQSTSDMFQTESTPGEWVQSIRPQEPILSFWFWSIHLVGLSAFSSLVIFKIRKRNPLLEDRRAKEKILDNKLKEAVKHSDRSGFYKTLHRRIRLRASVVYPNTNPSALSSQELIKLLRKRGLDQKLLHEISTLLNKCENHEYSGNLEIQGSLEKELIKAKSVIQKLK